MFKKNGNYANLGHSVRIWLEQGVLKCFTLMNSILNVENTPKVSNQAGIGYFTAIKGLKCHKLNHFCLPMCLTVFFSLNNLLNVENKPKTPNQIKCNILQLNDRPCVLFEFRM